MNGPDIIEMEEIEAAIAEAQAQVSLQTSVMNGLSEDIKRNSVAIEGAHGLGTEGPHTHDGEAGGAVGAVGAEYDPDTGTYGTITLLRDRHFHWWDGAALTDGAYDSKQEAEDTTYTGVGNYLCAKLDLTASYGYRWSIARSTTDMTTDSDQETRYWCLGKIVNGVYVDWIADDLVIWMG
jgi:hypothetical protein